MRVCPVQISIGFLLISLWLVASPPTGHAAPPDTAASSAARVGVEPTPQGSAHKRGTDEGALPAGDRERARAEERAAYVDRLIVRARQLNLASATTWLRLGHWQRSGWSRVWFVGSLAGFRSQADGMDLFLAADGRTSPEAELEATLRGFFAPVPHQTSTTSTTPVTPVTPANRVNQESPTPPANAANPTAPTSGDASAKAPPHPHDAHALCRFPARFLWLDRKLNFDRGRLAAPKCAGFREFIDLLQPKAAVVVFSSYYMSKAASAFGHTFFRIEKQAPLAGSERRQLLDMGIDYSAEVTTSNAMLYAILGMVGGFRGTFRRMPYYYKVREYNDFETRDLWEYRLDLNPEQLAMFVSHIWELGHTYFDYLYFTENCSYHILSALEVANPAWNLVAELKTPVIPADTIKALESVPGLVAEISYRPSLMTQFRRRIKGMSDAQLDMVQTLVDDPARAFPPSMDDTAEIEVLDAAADLIDIYYAEDVLYRPESHAAQAKLQLLTRRSKIAAPSEVLSIEAPAMQQPHAGHGTRRMGLGLGLDGDSDPFLALHFRATLHDLADSVVGYPELSQMEFLPLELHIPFEDTGLRLHSASLLRIVHLNAINRFNRRMSWKVDLGAQRIYDRGCDGCLAAAASVGGGATKAWLDDRLALFAMFDSQVRWSPDLDGVAMTPIRLGVGPSAGMRLRLDPRLIMVLDAAAMWLPYRQAPEVSWHAGGTLRWSFTEQMALDLDARALQGQFQGRLSALLYY